MKLIEVYKSLLEQEEALDDVFELPNENMAVSLFRQDRKILFTPQEHTSKTNKIRTLINMLKQQFQVLRVIDKTNGIFEIELDPRQNYEEVVDFIRQEADREKI